MATSGPVSAPATPESWVVRSDAYAQPFLDAWSRFEPEECSISGVPGLEEATQPLSADYAEEKIETFSSLLAPARRALDNETDPEVRFDLGVLVETTGRLVERLEVARASLVPYVNVPEVIYRGLAGPGETTAASRVRLRRYIGRCHGLLPICEQAEAMVRVHLGDGGRLAPYRRRVERDLVTAPHLLRGIRDAFAAAAEAEDDLAVLEAQLGRWTSFLRHEVLPRARESHQLPAELYRLELRALGIDLSADELRRRARVSFREIAHEMRSLAPVVARENGFTSTDPRSVLAALRGVQIPAAEVAGIYRQRLEELRRRVEDERFATVPENEIRMRLAAPAESAVLPGPFLRRPRLLDYGGEPLDFVVPASVPGRDGRETVLGDYTFDDATWTLTVHEAMPGHGLHYSCVCGSGLSKVRRVLDDGEAFIEGWAQYAETELRPGLPVAAQLVALQQRLLRASRAFLDPCLHDGRVTAGEALRFLTEEVGISETLACQEVERYTFLQPVHATAYFAGYAGLLELRAEVEERLGAAFDQRAYHDLLLRQGFLALPRLRERVLRVATGS